MTYSAVVKDSDGWAIEKYAGFANVNDAYRAAQALEATEAFNGARFGVGTEDGTFIALIYCEDYFALGSAS